MSDDSIQETLPTKSSEDEISENDITSQIIDEVFEADTDNAQLLIVSHLEALHQNQKGSELELFLKSFWNHLEGVRLVREEGNFVEAGNLEKVAEEGFKQLGFKSMESVSRCFWAYSNAIMELRSLNINRSLELFSETEKYLQEAGRFGGKYQHIIDHMKPESIFVGALAAIAANDDASAKVLTLQASAASKKIAEKYYEIGTPLHFTFLGLAHYYEAFYSQFSAQKDLHKLDLDRLVSEDITTNAKKAEQLLAQGDLTNLQIQSIHQFSKALVELTQVTKGLATRMHLCFMAAFKPDAQGFLDLRAMVHRAIDHASLAGQQALPLVRTCEELLIQIKNLEKLARPRKVDFGIYSGLISAVLFVILLVAASWTRYAFTFDIDINTLLPIIVGLSLVGGFGFGALRFKNFLFSHTQYNKTSQQETPLDRFK